MYSAYSCMQKPTNLSPLTFSGASFPVVSPPLTFQLVRQITYLYLPKIQPIVLCCRKEKNVKCLWETAPIGEVDETPRVALHFHLLTVERTMLEMIDLNHVSGYDWVKVWLDRFNWHDDEVVESQEDDWSFYFFCGWSQRRYMLRINDRSNLESQPIRFWLIHWK